MTTIILIFVSIPLLLASLLLWISTRQKKQKSKPRDWSRDVGRPAPDPYLVHLIHNQAKQENNRKRK